MKLVRNKIPQIIEDSGKECTWRRVYGEDEHLIFLRSKMMEEVDEFIAAPSYEEAADVFEVFRCLLHIHGLKLENVIEKANTKAGYKGNFKDGIVLTGVSD